MVEAKLLRKKLKNGLIVDKWDLVTIIEKQQAEIENMQERMIVAEKELNHMRSFFGCDPAYYGMTKAHPVKEHFEDEPQAEELHEIMQSNAELTLTDEEIREVYRQTFGYTLDETKEALAFARAILRKAQEK